MPSKLAALFLAAVLALLFLTGCFTDINTDPRFPTGYRQDEIYATAVDLPVRIYRDAIFKKVRGVTLFRPGVSPDPMGWENQVDTVAAGTRIKIVKILREKNVELGSVIRIDAVIASGPYSGVSADLWSISIREKSPNVDMGLIKRDPTILKESVK